MFAKHHRPFKLAYFRIHTKLLDRLLFSNGNVLTLINVLEKSIETFHREFELFKLFVPQIWEPI